MGRIICLMGKSAAGKDTIFKELMSDQKLDLTRIVPYTTRPVREGEQDGVEYFFTEEAAFRQLQEDGKVIESRAYHTCHGLWRYFTVNDRQLQDERRNYIIIGTLEAYRKLQDYFALDRERGQECPKYEEMCRRFLADSEDFSEEKIAEAGIDRRFQNDDLHRCLDEIRLYLIREM